MPRLNQSSYKYLLEDPEVKRWFDDLGRGSKITSDVHLQGMGADTCFALRTQDLSEVWLELTDDSILPILMHVQSSDRILETDSIPTNDLWYEKRGALCCSMCCIDDSLKYSTRGSFLGRYGDVKKRGFLDG